MRIASDLETNQFLNDIVVALGEIYPPEKAESLVRDYYSKFMDSCYCKSIGIPAQDDDFLFHEGVRGMALRVHYYLGLEGDPDPCKFIEWRAAISELVRRA